MRAKSLVAFAMAIGCGLVAMVGVQQSMKKQSKDLDADKITVFVASTEIPAGQVLDPTMLEKRKFLKGSAPKEAVTDISQLEKRALIVKVMPGDIIRLDKLGEPGKTGASISIPVGKRVITVPANQTLAHSGMLKPEDRVDVMVTYRVESPTRGGRDFSETKTFLSYIEVFATDSTRDPNAGADPSGKAAVLKNISLLVTPDEAQTIAMAKSIGELTLSLRNTSDKQIVEVQNLTPEQFRTQILQASMPPAEHKEEHPQRQPSTPNMDADQSLQAFVDDAMGEAGKEGAKETPVAKNGPAGTQLASVEPSREAWDIAIFGKAGVKVETIEVERRKSVVMPTQLVKTESETKKLINSLIDLVQPPKQDVVTQAPVQVGRPIFPDAKSDKNVSRLQAGVKSTLLNSVGKSSTSEEAGKSSSETVKAGPDVSEPSTPAKSVPSVKAEANTPKAKATGSSAKK